MSMCLDVYQFHERGSVDCPSKIAFPGDETIELRKKLNLEEVTETNEGLTNRDMVEAADGIIDSIYVLLGNAIALGIDARCFFELWHEVHRANMAKFVWHENTRRYVAFKNADGKVTKPPGWTPPDIEGVLRRHGWVPA